MDEAYTWLLEKAFPIGATVSNSLSHRFEDGALRHPFLVTVQNTRDATHVERWPPLLRASDHANGIRISISIVYEG
jgi:hypothetical protein